MSNPSADDEAEFLMSVHHENRMSDVLMDVIRSPLNPLSIVAILSSVMFKIGDFIKHVEDSMAKEGFRKVDDLSIAVEYGKYLSGQKYDDRLKALLRDVDSGIL